MCVQTSKVAESSGLTRKVPYLTLDLQRSLYRRNASSVRL